MRRIPKAMRIGLPLVAAIGLWGISLFRSQKPDLLRDVVEPITIVGGMSIDDGGSHSLTIEDARGKKIAVCLLDDFGGNTNLVVGNGKEPDLRDHPVGGPEERKFLALLERWCRGDADAQWWDDRLRRYKFDELKGEALEKGAPSGDFDLKARAVDMLQTLRLRNKP